MPTINFPGGATAGQIANIQSGGFFLNQNDVVFPLPANTVRQNINGSYIVRIHAISPASLSVASPVDIVLNYGGNNYGVGTILTFPSLTFGLCQIRIYNYDGQVDFGRSLSAGPGVQIYRTSTGLLYDSFSTAMSGTWSWNTVPTAPSSISTSLSGTTVTVTRGTSTTTTEGPITSYRIQRRESTNGVTFGSWSASEAMSSTTFTYTGLTPARYYQFRVFARNNAGDSVATVSSTVFVAAITRYTTQGVFTVLTKLKKYDGTAWQNITQAKRWNGTSWVTIDITGINST